MTKTYRCWRCGRFKHTTLIFRRWHVRCFFLNLLGF